MSAADRVSHEVDADGATTISESAQRPAKRRKVQLACTSCRDRKTRCDGLQPHCSTCKRRGIASTCLYEEGSLRTQRLVWALEEKLRQYEKTASISPERSAEIARSLLAKSSTSVRREPAPTSSPEQTHRLALSYDTRLEPTGTSLTSNAETAGLSEYRHLDHEVANRAEPSPSHTSVTASDGLATTSPLHGNLDVVYGASSTIAFVRKVFSGRAVDDLDAESPHSVGVGRTKTIPNGQDLDMLPLRKTADNYITCFLDIVYPVFPVIHVPSFQGMYNRLWESEDADGGSDAVVDPATLSTVNLIFAMGCQFSGNVEPAKRTALADQFYQRSRKLVPMDALDSISIPVVQSLLLIAIYLQSTKYSTRCWNVLGVAIRAAQSLGMHFDHKVSASTDHLAREMRRRVWHVAVTLDRLVSMVFGRPTMIPQPSRVPLPLMIDDERTLELEEMQVSGSVPSQTGLFIYTARLFETLDEVLCTFYSEDDSSTKALGNTMQEKISSKQQITDVFRINSMLDAFYESVPRELRKPYQPDVMKTEILEARVLNVRFLYVRLLLLRPVLLAVIRRRDSTDENSGSSGPKLEDDLAIDMCRLCLSTAHSLVALLSEELGGLYRCSAWYSVYFTFGAIIIVAASQLCPALRDEAEGARFETSWNLAMRIFEQYSIQLRSASHAIQTLKAFRRFRTFGVTEVRENPPPQRAENGQTLSAYGLLSGSIENQDQYYDDWRRSLEDNQFYQMPEYQIDPLTEGWFSQQMMSFDFPELVQRFDRG